MLHTTWLGSLIVHTPLLRNYLEHLTVAKGHQYDQPASREQIADFIAAYGIPLDSIPKPVEEYQTLNEFFSRGHKPGARPTCNPKCACTSTGFDHRAAGARCNKVSNNVHEEKCWLLCSALPGVSACLCTGLTCMLECWAACRDDATAVQPCDCRLMVFPNVSASQRLWIKGRQFTLRKLLGSVYSSKWDGCSIALSRLAPGDYHHYHAPCCGKIAQMTLIPGGRYSVKPVRCLTLQELTLLKSLDVYCMHIAHIAPPGGLLLPPALTSALRQIKGSLQCTSNAHIVRSWCRLW